jgi:3-phenylpropionate/trans-cinnamate dioxygenase ferredoxin reductase subunit
MSGIVIIGGGQAAQSLAAKLRQLGATQSITLIAEEPVVPYQRPPLSKKYLTGEMALDRLYLRPESWYGEQHIDVRLKTRAAAIDRASHEVLLETGERIAYTQLALTTGSLPRLLPETIGGRLDGVYTMRTLDDANRMASELAPGRRALVVGGGYIGLEGAAVAASKGLSVTVLEVAGRILQRVAADQTSDYFRALHRGHGVDIRERTGLKRLIGDDGRVVAAELADGSEIAVDFAIVGIGIVPDDRLAREAGVTIDNGIAVDAHCRTSDPDIFAAGDCASFPHQGERIRLESVGNAIDMGECVAANMLGQTTDYVAKPWFWSDQYDVKLQIAGLNRGYDATVLRPGKRAGAQSVWYYRGGRLIAVDAMNDAAAYTVGKRLIEAGRSLPQAIAADAGANLKDFLEGV